MTTGNVRVLADYGQRSTRQRSTRRQPDAVILPPLPEGLVSRSLFYSEPVRVALRELWFAMLNGEAAQLIGEAGVGKTLLCCELLRRMPRSVHTLYVTAPEHGYRSFLSRVQDNIFMAQRQRALTGVAQHWVIAIDDAHRPDALTLARIGELRQQARGAGLSVGVLLAGRSGLDETMALPPMQRFSEQVTTRCTLAPCTYAETRSLIQHWLRAQGAPGAGCTDSAGRIVYYATGGVPRQIEQVCGRALEALRARGGTTINAMAAARAAWGIFGN
jgi:MSHA biogenesis protein MshM